MEVLRDRSCNLRDIAFQSGVNLNALFVPARLLLVTTQHGVAPLPGWSRPTATSRS